MSRRPRSYRLDASQYLRGRVRVQSQRRVENNEPRAITRWENIFASTRGTRTPETIHTFIGSEIAREFDSARDTREIFLFPSIVHTSGTCAEEADRGELAKAPLCVGARGEHLRARDPIDHSSCRRGAREKARYTRSTTRRHPRESSRLSLAAIRHATRLSRTILPRCFRANASIQRESAYRGGRKRAPRIVRRVSRWTRRDDHLTRIHQVTFFLFLSFFSAGRRARAR